MPTTTRSYRLEERLLEQIAALAKKHGITENQLVSKWLSSRAFVDPLVSVFGEVTLGQETFATILGITQLDALELSGWELGKKHFSSAKAIFEAVDEQLTFTTFLGKLLANQAHWFRCERDTPTKSREMILDHDFPINWSIFLRSYLSGAYEVVSREKLQIEIENKVVRVKFPAGS
jgi:hypothetical protein